MNEFSQVDFGPLKTFLDNDDVTDISYSNGGQVWLKTLSKGVYRVENTGIDNALIFTSSHVCVSQRQFRYPIEYASLSYDTTTATFASDLNNMEIDILADYTVISWYEANINDVLEFKESLQDREFKRLATGQNLKPRQEYLTMLYTRVKQNTTNYLWSNWSSLPFFGGASNEQS